MSLSHYDYPLLKADALSSVHVYRSADEKNQPAIFNCTDIPALQEYVRKSKYILDHQTLIEPLANLHSAITLFELTAVNAETLKAFTIELILSLEEYHRSLHNDIAEYKKKYPNHSEIISQITIDFANNQNFPKSDETLKLQTSLEDKIKLYNSDIKNLFENSPFYQKTLASFSWSPVFTDLTLGVFVGSTLTFLFALLIKAFFTDPRSPNEREEDRRADRIRIVWESLWDGLYAATPGGAIGAILGATIDNRSETKFKLNDKVNNLTLTTKPFTRSHTVSLFNKAKTADRPSNANSDSPTITRQL